MVFEIENLFKNNIKKISFLLDFIIVSFYFQFVVFIHKILSLLLNMHILKTHFSIISI